MKNHKPESSSSVTGSKSAPIKRDRSFQGEPAKHTAPLSLPEALKQSQELLTAYFSASNVGFCILDTAFHYVAVNESLARMNRVSAAEHAGKSIREIVGGFAEVVEPYLQKVVDTGQPAVGLELSFILPRRSDPDHWIIHYVPIKNAAGKVTHIGSVVVEVTEQKKLEESLRSLSENLHLEKKRQEVLLQVSRLLETSWDPRRVFPRVSAYLRRVLRQEYAALSLREEESGQLLPPALDFPLGKDLTVGLKIGTASVPAAKVLEERAPIILSGEEIRELDPGMALTVSSEGLKSLCWIPLIRPKGPVGVLVLGSTRTNAFHNEDLNLLSQVAAQLAIVWENATSAREIERLKQRLKQEKKPKQEKRFLANAPRTHRHFEEIVGRSPALQHVLNQVDIIADNDATVLILGETGTGKGLVAQAVHRTSKRHTRTFVMLNCAAIPTGLLESELFGHEKGAFTGAVSQKIGRLELADGGTLFLDEIGDIPLEMQPKLLRVLQDHEFERLGGTRTIKVNLRLIAATNRDLPKSVVEKQFRSDLFYRLNVFPIRLPSLRERREDIPLLIQHFVGNFSRAMGRNIENIPAETMDALIQWHWPGNVRELQNFIERSVILTEGNALVAPLEELQVDVSQPPEQSLERAEREHIIRILRETGGMISGRTGAASRLGLKRTTLQSKMQRLGIGREDYSGKSGKKV
ncbi:MAG: sigma 54-interacting transcriptional regulator [Candidatus Sulfotelmatobacter sp.]